MAEICRGVASDGEVSSKGSRAARRRRMEIRRFKIVTGVASPETTSLENRRKRQKLEVFTASLSRSCENAVENCETDEEEEGKKLQLVKVEKKKKKMNGKVKTTKEIIISSQSLDLSLCSAILAPVIDLKVMPKYGVASVCGRRRDMEDAVAVHPFFSRTQNDAFSELHYFGVYDGHGCSHVAMRCRDRLHELVKEELESSDEVALAEWKAAMRKSFWRMDKEVITWNERMVGANCRCEMQTPKCDAVGSTAVVAIVTPDKIIVANCGDSRAVLCRNGKPISLSSDHKPDRPDELNRIQAAGGRVIYWDGPRVLGVLAMSRAIGDNYLKPYVSCEPEVTVTERTAEDECLILASDGLWDVVSNETACGVARMCLKGKGARASSSPPNAEEDIGCGVTTSDGAAGEMSDKACSDASMLLTKLALARQSTDNVSVVVVDLRRDT